MDSDDEIRRVPEIGCESAGPAISGRGANTGTGPAQPSTGSTKKRGRNPADKEHKRVKR